MTAKGYWYRAGWNDAWLGHKQKTREFFQGAQMAGSYADYLRGWKECKASASLMGKRPGIDDWR